VSIAARLTVLALTAAGCGGGSGADGPRVTGWHNAAIDAVSRPAVGSGVTAVTALLPDGHLQTVTADLASGRRLWAQPATIAGRPTAMGVAPPAVAGTADHPIVANVEPHGSGAALVGRDARTGTFRWQRPIESTFGPSRCGDLLCLSESSPDRAAAFSVLDPANGRAIWRVRGVSEVEWSDPHHVALFRMSARPAIEEHDLASGKRLWSFSIEDALGHGASLAGGWAFGALGDSLIGYLAPFQPRKDSPLTPFGFFSVRLDDGKPQWTRRRLLRVFPSANPAVALITREVDGDDRYGGFTQLDPRTGRSMREISAAGAPRTDWWLAFPTDLSTLGFLAHDRAGRTYDLHTGRTVTGHPQGWSFCTTSPTPLRIAGRPGFYPIAALCPYDLRTGHKLNAMSTPPAWYTGAVDGWRVWRDERGGLHGVHDTDGTSPGMYP
jgi:outer membrane protein assembly factor BamB